MRAANNPIEIISKILVADSARIGHAVCKMSGGNQFQRLKWGWCYD
jgi:hypothetical protein